jgi:superfamily II DNA or RNA helicase
VAQCVRRSERATVLVPSVLLQRQWQQQFQRFVPEATIAKVGGLGDGDPYRADVVIAVVNTAMKNDLSDYGSNMTLLVADEVHRYGGESWSGALRHGYEKRLGLTATLERGGDDGVVDILLPYFGSIAHHYGFDRATRERVVAPFDLVFLGVRLEDQEQAEYDALSRRISQARKILIGAGANPRKLNQELASLRSMGGDITRAVMTYESATRERRRLLADTGAKQEALLELVDVVGESRGTVIFTQSKETADAAASILEDCGLRAAAIYSEGMSPGQRQSLIDALGDEELDALAAPKILDEGVDIPDIDLGIVMGASSSRRQMIQRLGRVIRLKSDNRRARFVILYVIDSVEDPASGNRDDFMDEVEDAASKVLLFEDWDESTIDDIWGGVAPSWRRDPTRVVPGEAHLPDIAPELPAVPRRSDPPLPRAAKPRVPDPAPPAATIPTAQTAAPLEPPLPAVRMDPGPPKPPAPSVRDILAAQAVRDAAARARAAAQEAARAAAQEALRQQEPAPTPAAPDVQPSRPRTRVSKPLPAPRRPDYPDPVMLADILDSIDESIALAVWLRSELATQRTG